jgi:hypothetical protein
MAKSESRFRYQPRDDQSVKARANQQTGTYDSMFKIQAPTFKPKQGLNEIRYMPPTWEPAEHYGLDVWSHRDIGPNNDQYLCPAQMAIKPDGGIGSPKDKRCAICDARAQIQAEGGSAEDLKALRPQRQVLVWIIDRGDEANGPTLWLESPTMDKAVTNLQVDSKTGKSLLIDHPDEGYDFEFKRDGTNLNTRYTGERIARDPSPLHPKLAKQEQWLDYITEHKLPDILNYYDYDYVQRVFAGKKADDGDDRGGRVRDEARGGDRDRDADRGRSRDDNDRGRDRDDDRERARPRDDDRSRDDAPRGRDRDREDDRRPSRDDADRADRDRDRGEPDRAKEEAPRSTRPRFNDADADAGKDKPKDKESDRGRLAKGDIEEDPDERRGGARGRTAAELDDDIPSERGRSRDEGDRGSRDDRTSRDRDDARDPAPSRRGAERLDEGREDRKR